VFKSLKNKLSEHEFLRHVLTLMTGTGLAQVLALGLSIIITRLYTPEEFSTLEQFAMLLAIGGVIVCGKYEFAIMQPKKDEDARTLLALSMRIALSFAVLVAIAVFFMADQVGRWYDNPTLASILWLLPIAIVGMGFFNSLNYWYSRKKQYKRAATSKVLFTATSDPAKIVLGTMGQTAFGLVWAVTIGRLVSASYMVLRFVNDGMGSPLRARKEDIKRLASEYKVYPLYTIWGSALNRFAQWAHILLFSYYYGPLMIGFFALSRRIFLGPLSIISQSYSQVFYQRISEMNDSAELKRFYFKNLIRFLGVGAIMVLVVHLLPDNALGFIFGEEWTGTLQVLKPLSFWYALNFVTSSLSFINFRLHKQRAMLLLDALHFALAVGSILWAFDQGMDEWGTLVYLVWAKIIYFAVNICASVYFVSTYEFQEPAA
jgi:O-antigen/teichoic acid export membrane protein